MGVSLYMHSCTLQLSLGWAAQCILCSPCVAMRPLAQRTTRVAFTHCEQTSIASGSMWYGSEKHLWRGSFGGIEFLVYVHSYIIYIYIYI